MPHYHLEGFENEWTLVRETSSSQMFRVKTPKGHELAIDVHYTPPKILTANVVFKGKNGVESLKSTLSPVMDELGQIALKRGDYAVIDYTLSETGEISDGNYSVDEKDRKHRQL